MEVKQAIATARTYFTEVFADEDKQRPTLEEVWFDETRSTWHITFGLQRSQGRTLFDPLGHLTSNTIYKVVEVADKDGKIVSIKVRNPEPV